MNTDTPTAPVAQQKTLAERIEETRALERVHWDICDKLEKEMEPFKKRFEAARTIWSKHYNRLRYLEDMAKEEAGKETP